MDYMNYIIIIMFIYHIIIIATTAKTKINGVLTKKTTKHKSTHAKST